MNPLLSLLMSLLTLTPLAPATLHAPGPAMEALGTEPFQSAAAVEPTYRLLVRNDGDSTPVKVSITGAGVPYAWVGSLPGHQSTMFQSKVGAGRASADIWAGLVSGASSADPSRCPSHIAQTNATLKVVGTSWSISLGETACVGKA